MSKTENFNVYKDIPCIVKARADGKWDYSTVTNFTTDNQNVSVNMTAYDGLSHSVIPNYQSVDTYDFSGTILPWKWQYNRYLQIKRFAFDEVGQNHTVTLLGGYNFDCYGAVSFNENTKVVSNFSLSNYVSTKDKINLGTNTWEFGFKFKTATLSGTQTLLAGYTDKYFTIFINSSKKLSFNIGTGDAWTINDIVGTTTLANTTDYWAKLIYDGATVELFLSTNGTTYTSEVSTTTTLNVPEFPLAFGIDRTLKNNYFTGSFYFSDVYININNNLSWEPALNQAKQQAGNYTVTGSPVVSQTFIASNFSTSNYLQLTQPFQPGNDTWEVILKVRTGSTMNVQQTLWGSVTSFYKTVGGELSADNKFRLGITSNGSTWDIAWLIGTTVAIANTDYWLKMSYTGTEYKLELSTDGVNYNLENSVTSSTSVYQGNDSIIRIGRQGSTLNTWKGYIYLMDCSIKINNQAWWSGTTYVTESLPGCTYNYNGEQTVNCFVVNHDQSIVLTPDSTYTDGYLLGTITI